MAAATLANEIVNYLNEDIKTHRTETFPEDFNGYAKDKNDSAFDLQTLRTSVKSENSGNILVFRIKSKSREMSYREVLTLWESNEKFVDFFISILKKSGFNSYVWETPSVTKHTIDQPFEFVLINSPMPQKPDPTPYEEYYDLSKNNGVVFFPNLGHDAILIVPSPYRKNSNYSDLCSFFREAPIEQQRAIWKTIAVQLQLIISKKPTWLSVAGGGIAWLHIRLDSSPKYYRYLRYCKL